MKKFLLPGVLFCALFACHSPTPEAITIATAANVQYAMDTLTARFSRQTGIPCQVIVSSSGKLTAQIREGAPYDLLVSADMKYPQSLYEAGKTLSPPQVYARGTLVLWSTLEGPPPSIESLTAPAVQHIALANPQTAPYGRSALEVIQHQGLEATLRPKFVFGESISQCNQFILSGAAQVGFTAKSVVLSPSIAGKGRWTEIDPSTYTPIDQGAVLIRREGQQTEKARAFLEFLFSPEAQHILTRFGYSVNPADTSQNNPRG